MMSNHIGEQMQRDKVHTYNMIKQQLLSTGRNEIVNRVEECVILGIQQNNFNEDTPAGDAAMELRFWLWEKGGRNMLDEGFYLSDGAFYIHCGLGEAAKLSSRLHDTLFRRPSKLFMEKRGVQLVKDLRKKSGQCIMCGEKLKLFQRLFGAIQHKTCISFEFKGDLW